MIEELPNNLLKVINNGESINVEFKQAKKSLPSTLFEKDAEKEMVDTYF